MNDNITALIPTWVMEDCGDIFNVGKDYNAIQMEAVTNKIKLCKNKEKQLKQISMNKYSFNGKVIAILKREIFPEDGIVTDVIADGVHIEFDIKKSFKKEKINEVIEAIIIDCGIPIRFVCINKEHSNNNAFPDNIKLGSCISSQCDIICFTCVDDSVIRKPVSATILKIYRSYAKENFRRAEEINNTGNPFEIKDDKIFVTWQIKKIGKLWDDTKGRMVLKLLK